MLKLLISLVSRYLSDQNPQNCGSEVKRANVHLFFMIFRLKLITMKIRFWTFTAASKFLRQHILTLCSNVVKKDSRKLSLTHLWYTFTLSNKGSFFWRRTCQKHSENYQGDIQFLLKWNANPSKLHCLIMICPDYGTKLNGLHVILKELV